MAQKFKAPYKNNTIKGMAGNAEAFRQHVNKTVGERGNKVLDDTADTIVGVSNQINDNLNTAYNDAKTFFSGQAQANLSKGQRIPQRNGGKIAPREDQEVFDISGEMPGTPEQAPTNNGGGTYGGGTYGGYGTNKGVTYQGGGATGGVVTGGQTTTSTQGGTQQSPKFATEEEAVYYLAQQPGWNNLTEEERVRRVNELWDRGGNTNDQQTTREGQQGSPEFSPRGQADNGGVIYGRGTSNEIITNADPYSVDANELRQREANYQSLQSMNSYDIALAESSGYSLYGETAMRDLATNDPAKYQEIQEWKRRIQQGDTVNAIASGNNQSTTTQIQNATGVVNDSIDKWTKANSTERSYDDTLSVLTGILGNNQTANDATNLMLNIHQQIEAVEQQIANLPNTVKKEFKGDVPQYIYEARMANEGQRLKAELSKLESRYNSALDIYKTQLSNAQWQAEMNLKERQYNFNVSQQNWENAFKTRQQAWTEKYQAQSLMLNNIKTDKNGKPYVINADGTYTYLTDATYSQAVQQQIDMAIDTLNTVWKDGVDGKQCEQFSDNFNNTLYGKTMLPVDQAGNYIQGRTSTTAWEKAQYVNSAMPSKGMTAIFNYGDRANVSDAAKKRGHTMIVTGYDPITRMISLKGSNRTGDEKVYSTQMSLDDFYNKYRGVGFWDPTQPTWFESQNGAVATQNGLGAMQTVFDDLFTNATTDGQRNVLATAEAMYSSLAEMRDDGTLYELIKSKDLEKMLLSFKQKDFTKAGEDGGTLIMTQISKYIQNNAVGVESQIALNKFLRLIEMKLRKESGAAISSSEWYSNFQMMIPQSYENERLMYSKLDNWDDLIRLYARTGGMKSRDEYIPIFANGVTSGRETW